MRQRLPAVALPLAAWALWGATAAAQRAPTGTGDPGAGPDPAGPEAAASPASSPAAILAALALLPRPPRHASPYVPAGHWAVEAARRLDGLGLTPAEFDWGAQTLSRRELAWVFAEAVVRAQRDRPKAAPLALAYAARFLEEFGPDAVRAAGLGRGGAALLGGAAGPMYERRTGAIRAGRGYYNEPTEDWQPGWTPPEPLPDVEVGRASVTVAAALGRALAVAASSSVDSERTRFQEAYAVVSAGPVSAWAGRRGPGYGPGAGGGVVLDGGHAFDGAGLRLTDGARLPGPGRMLGPVRFELMGSRVERNGHVERPWVATARLSVSPHPRFGIGFNRAAMFGGEGAAPVTPRSLFHLLVGKHGGEYGELENQLASVDVRLRVDAGPVPLRFHMEWGMEDSSGAYWHVPGIVAGVEAPALPGLPNVGVGIERAAFSGSCCGNPKWYRNLFFLEGWADDGRALGHPLGGHGREWLGTVRVAALDARLQATARGFRRVRGDENIYAPSRMGESLGGGVTALFRIGPAVEATLDGSVERGGSDWRTTFWKAGLRWIF